MHVDVGPIGVSQQGGNINVPMLFRCDVLKRVAAPVDAKTCKSTEPQFLAANTKTERQEISRGSALVSQSNPSTLGQLARALWAIKAVRLSSIPASGGFFICAVRNDSSVFCR